LQAREFSASRIPRACDAVSAGGGNGVNNDEPAAAAPVGTKTRVLWVQQVGAKSWAEMPISSTLSVARMVKEIKKKLELSAPLDSITLQLAVKDAGGTDNLVVLDSMYTIDGALAKALGGAAAPTAKLRIIVNVAAPAATLAEGEWEECYVCVFVRASMSTGGHRDRRSEGGLSVCLLQAGVFTCNVGQETTSTPQADTVPCKGRAGTVHTCTRHKTRCHLSPCCTI
jgi:hypothetical protein